MAITVGILVFDGVDELDFVGPLEVFSYATGWGQDGNEVAIVGREKLPIRGVNGLTFIPTYDFCDVPSLDIVVVPGGHGTTALVGDEIVLTWLRDVAVAARWVASVCSGSFVLQAAGLTDGRRITTHSRLIDRLRTVHSGEVVQEERYVVDGNIITSAGVSAGIDAALWLIGELFSPDHSRTVRRSLDYNPSPPY